MEQTDNSKKRRMEEKLVKDLNLKSVILEEFDTEGLIFSPAFVTSFNHYCSGIIM